jgi:N-acetylglucosamine kinase-like BadF-type ATPase
VRTITSSHVLGVDGGNTKTVAAIADLSGVVIGMGRSGCSDIYAVGSTEHAIREIGNAIEIARREAGVHAEELASSAFSLAGADWPEDIRFLQSALSGLVGGGRTVVVNDAMGALRAGSAHGAGVAVVCGTGAATGARRRDGREWHTSWWQEPQGSRHLAQQALRAVYRAELAIDPMTTLTSRILQLHGEHKVEAVLHGLTAHTGRSAVNHAAITTILLDEAERGDRTASRIVHEHGRALGDYAVAAAAKIELDDAEFPLVLTGGVFRHAGTILPGAIVERVRATYPQVRPVVMADEPVVGAVMLALEAAGVSIEPSVLSRLHVTVQRELVSLLDQSLATGACAT